MSRKPLLAREIPHVQRLGALLSTTRRALGLTQAEVAREAGMHWTSLQRLELGTRRTRRSTLRRLAAAFVAHAPKLGPVDALTDQFVAAAGPALAEESVYAERVARRRAVREDRAWRVYLAERRLSLLDAIERWERTDYARMLSPEERWERWESAADLARADMVEAAEQRANLAALRHG
jgi:transcriptional regulator with XRE-family HTH domain